MRRLLCLWRAKFLGDGGRFDPFTSSHSPIPQFIAMLKDVIRSVDYSDCAEIALAMFVVAFAMMVFAVLRLSRKSADRFASIPLSDQVKDPRDE
ncbi:hypothetical protein Pan14r_30560 [Crateriforma conspicua]|uniref:Cbb3-type cytochrome oxidase component FixQ n=2 Tax=Planctomycetaceae TaxID=126 RepID=A0A5C5Y741_9PLAN|nr:hypothetical protein Pan14r_30560 [Crateriforma conspicua]